MHIPDEGADADVATCDGDDGASAAETASAGKAGVGTGADVVAISAGGDKGCVWRLSAEILQMDALGAGFSSLVEHSLFSSLVVRV